MPDLISLAKVSRSFRKLFLSPVTRSIWATQRRQEGYELLSDMDEVDFAVFLFGSGCHECGSAAGSTLFKLRTRLCQFCRKERLIDDREIRIHHKYLHSEAVECVPTDRGLYRLADLQAVNAKLAEVEDEDENTRIKNQRLTVWTTKSRRRSSAPVGEVRPADAVESFVEKMKEDVSNNTADMQRIIDRRTEVEILLRREAWERREKEEAAEEAKIGSTAQELEANFGWTTEQAAFYKARRRRYTFSAPTADPADDPAAWTRLKNRIQAILDKEESERQAQPGREARLAVLQDLFDALTEDLQDDLDHVAPSWPEFRQNAEIKSLWHPTYAQLDSNNVAKYLPTGRKVFRSYAQDMRVEAIRHILAAQEHQPIRSFSSSAASYPEDEYDSAWFSRLTHIFFISSVSRTGWNHPYAYPACCTSSGYGKLRYRLAGGISYKQVCAVKAVIEAAGLDVDTATKRDIEKKGGTFRWPECPKKMRRQSQLGWAGMVRLIVRNGPGVRKLEAGEKVELEYTPPAPVDSQAEDPVSNAYSIFGNSSDTDSEETGGDWGGEDVAMQDEDEEQDEENSGNETQEDE
ncbi:hypothetical protein JCM11251_000942 [Rhodosporidiobolus azoricus]